MDCFLHAAKVEIARLGIPDHLLDLLLILYSVGHADGVNIAGSRFLQFEVFTPHTAEKLLISGFLVTQTEVDALFDVVGGKKNDSTFVLQLVVHADEVMEHRLGQLVRLVEDQKRLICKEYRLQAKLFLLQAHLQDEQPYPLRQ